MSTIAERLERYKNRPRSNSQYKEYNDCGYRVYLKRIQLAWDRPAAWLTQGLAVHAVVEAIERSGRTMTLEQAREAFSEAYAAETERYTATTPNLDHWFSSGRYRGAEDIERRYRIGLEQVEKYIDYIHNTPNEKIWTTPDGTPAIELPFELELDGVKVIGYIDQVVMQAGFTEPHVRDIKTGQKPGDEFQLAIYAVAMNETYGTNITTGDYWMAKNKNPVSTIYDLSEWTKERLAEEFHRLDNGIKSEIFEPNPERNKCNRCGVKTSCPFSIG